MNPTQILSIMDQLKIFKKNCRKEEKNNRKCSGTLCFTAKDVYKAKKQLHKGGLVISQRDKNDNKLYVE